MAQIFFTNIFLDTKNSKYVLGEFRIIRSNVTQEHEEVYCELFSMHGNGFDTRYNADDYCRANFPNLPFVEHEFGALDSPCLGSWHIFPMACIKELLLEYPT